ncbi:sulfotransferase [Prosthecobacter sp.]|uniref:sulfotransferase n=1 Tax=Prosthecobacter sp. TaxID=1965333 RepID=UPI002AB89F60|nr:sulfotransferase [Prosthecobacter sp.]MDZ4405797.1 sulfotransferase [Prosthecobacter sp.]
MKKMIQKLTQGIRERKHLTEAVLTYLVPVRQPLLLISQVQRSGGTLLSQLLDAHPELHAHPHELKIGRPKKEDWPQLDPKESPGKLFGEIWEENTRFFLQNGYRKDIKTREQKETFRCLFLPSIMRRAFLADLGSKPSPAQRDVLDSYFTAYFNGWLDNRNLHGAKKYVSGFVPSLSSRPASMERYWQDYPDGRVIFIVRDPCSWYASASKYMPQKFGNLEDGLHQWTASTEAILESRGKKPQQTLLYTFEDLVTRTEEVMRSICRNTGLSYHPTVLEPTFNGMPIRAASSFSVDHVSHGVIKETAQRRHLLDDSTIRRIEEKTSSIYSDALNKLTPI